MDVSGGATSSEAATALLNAINGNTTEDINSVSEQSELTIQANDAGVAGNGLVDVTTDCANAEWDNDTLTGGLNAVLGNRGEFFLNNGDLYLAMQDITDPSDDSGWTAVFSD